MNHHPPETEESLESDAVWKLLDQSPPVTASGRFTGDVVRAACLSVKDDFWWQKLLSPTRLAGLVAATGLTCAVIFLVDSWEKDHSPTTPLDPAYLEEIQEVVETETLIAAVDHLDDFSDMELASLIGF